MAHLQQLTFVKTIAEHFTHDYSNVKILEIGSYDVNGSIRKFFLDSDYLGADLVEGPCVDIISDGHLIDHKKNTYDITISCECFEHNPYWFETFINMHRMTKSGGFLVFTCATKGRLEHGTYRTNPTVSPGSQSIGWDYYYNLEEKDFVKKTDLSQLFDHYLFLSNNYSKDLYFVGKKIGKECLFNFDKKRFIKEYYHQQSLLKMNSSFLKTIINFLRSIIFIPVSLASYLPQHHFHNFSLFYLRILKYIRSKTLSFCFKN